MVRVYLLERLLFRKNTVRTVSRKAAVLITLRNAISFDQFEKRKMINYVKGITLPMKIKCIGFVFLINNVQSIIIQRKADLLIIFYPILFSL